VTAKQVEKEIKADGWYEVRSSNGSHKQYKHDTKKGKVTIPFHSGHLPPGTLNSILKQAGLK
jgi:predicted RNA binding protein YcfA (HicA-like mRNA interferase family)